MINLEKLIIIYIYYINYQKSSSASNISAVNVSAINVTTLNVSAVKHNATIKFPPNFSFGVATAAYQIEGGWNADGKGPSNWDTFTHNHPELIADKSNGDIAADSYHLFDEDLKALNELEVNFYRFSISWSRILPTGNLTSKNQLGINYYNNMINKLIENHIEPVVTLHQFDTPQKLEELGGFGDPMIIQYFVTYADVLFKEFGDRVKTWITFNEPYINCHYGYGDGVYAPGIKSVSDKEYVCMDHTTKAHAMVYKLYRSKYYDKFKGKIGIAVNVRYYANDNEKIDKAVQINVGLIIHSIFSKTGGYHTEFVNETLKRNKQKKSAQWNGLPTLNATWKSMIKGSADFVGLNYFTSTLDIANTSNIEPKINETLTLGQTSEFYYNPKALEEILKYIREKYGNVEIIITENGLSDKEKYNDDRRIIYLKDHLQIILNAINNGSNITGYTVWSLIDNFELNRGYTEKFGLYSVDFSSPSKPRTAKKSAKYYNHIIRTRKLNDFSLNKSSKIHHQIDIIIFLTFLTILNL